jgi:hypothetical protein
METCGKTDEVEDAEPLNSEENSSPVEASSLSP